MALIRIDGGKVSIQLSLAEKIESAPQVAQFSSDIWPAFKILDTTGKTMMGER